MSKGQQILYNDSDLYMFYMNMIYRIGIKEHFDIQQKCLGYNIYINYINGIIYLDFVVS